MGESDADSQTQGRFAQSMSRLSGGLTSAGTTMAAGVSSSSAIGADVLGAAGVGHQAPTSAKATSRAGRRPAPRMRPAAGRAPNSNGQRAVAKRSVVPNLGRRRHRRSSHLRSSHRQFGHLRLRRRPGLRTVRPWGRAAAGPVREQEPPPGQPR